jgi:protein SCO1/2
MFQFAKCFISVVLACLTCGFPQESFGQLLTDTPANAQSIDVEDRVGEFIPLDLIFKDERGNDIGLGRFFKQGKPVVLTLNYSDCPGLCIAQLDMLVSTLRDLNGAGIGEDFDILTVSIDPTESPEKASRTKAKYLGLLNGTKAESGWHFLTGKQTEIRKLADAVGFRYSYDKVNKRYNHAAATYFISSDGRICRYFLSLGTEPEQFKFAIAEAAEGKLTRSLADAIIQMCFLYDPDANRYSADARRIMAFGGAAFTMLLLGFTAPFWFSRRGKKSANGDAGAGAAKVSAPDCVTSQPLGTPYNKNDFADIEPSEPLKQDS